MKTPTWPEIISGISSIGAWVTAWYAASKVKEVHVLINSRLSALLKLTEDASFAAGKKSEKDKQDQFVAGQNDQKQKDTPPP
jgi:hypothetical protein